MPTPDEVLGWIDHSWDDELSMLWNPPGSYDGLFPDRSVHVVPPTAWHALGLLARARDRDVERALRAITAVIDCQLDDPGTPWHGTFARFREFPKPQPGAQEFVGYDPNWRQFVGCAFALTLLRFGDTLPAATREAMHGAIARAVDGEPGDRITPTYTNIALLHAWLAVFAGERFERPDQVVLGETLAQRIAERFDRHGTFDEWNCPTYYGVDLLALALWRSHSSSAILRAAGERLERELWNDLAPWYHAGLANLAGPYTRAYGMDMTRYVAAAGLWIAEAVDHPGGGRSAQPAPVPDLGSRVAHSHDLTLAPVVAMLASRPSPPALAMVQQFDGERQVRRLVTDDPERIATAWLSGSVMVGAESGRRRWSGWAQYHPATVHWLTPEGRVRWIRMVHGGPVDALAGQGVLDAACQPHRSRGVRPTSFLISAAEDLTAQVWHLPGLTVTVDTDAEFHSVRRSGQLEEVRYEAPASGAAHFELSFKE